MMPVVNIIAHCLVASSALPTLRIFCLLRLLCLYALLWFIVSSFEGPFVPSLSRVKDPAVAGVVGTATATAPVPRLNPPRDQIPV